MTDVLRLFWTHIAAYQGTCVKCCAAPGKRCRNYKGQGKQICQSRLDAVATRAVDMSGGRPMGQDFPGESALAQPSAGPTRVALNVGPRPASAPPLQQGFLFPPDEFRG